MAVVSPPWPAYKCSASPRLVLCSRCGTGAGQAWGCRLLDAAIPVLDSWPSGEAGDRRDRAAEPRAARVRTGSASRRTAHGSPPNALRPDHDETHPEPVPVGEVVRYDIEVWPTSYVFHQGNRIRVEIANGDSMIADGLFHHYYGHRAGTDIIRHDSQYPSHLLKPAAPWNT